MHGQVDAEDAFQLLLNDRIAFFQDQDFVARGNQPSDHLPGHGILRNLQYRIFKPVGIVFREVVERDTGRDDTQLPVRCIIIYIVGGILRRLFDGRLCRNQGLVAFAGQGREEDIALPPVFGAVHRVLRFQFLRNDSGARVCHACRDAEQDRIAQPLGKLEAVIDHIVGFLLARGLEHRNHREVSVHAVVLFVLRRVHRGVVGGYDNHAAVDAAHRRIHKAICRYVHAHVLHAAERTLAGITHTQGRFHRRLFVGAPAGVDAPLLGYRRALDVFGYFR